jgi:hypothetical protein
MRPSPSSSVSRARFRPGAAVAVAMAAAAWLVAPSPGAGQSALETRCAAAEEHVAPECFLALAGTRAVQERVGIALWGGSPVPGTASTLGMRIGSTPRVSVSARLSLVPMEVPPLLDRARFPSGREGRTLIAAVSAQTTVGVFQGFSPLPTVGGVLSVDALTRLSAARLPGGAGFDDGVAVGWSGGVRVGVLRESFTMPGVSVTTSYGRSTSVTLGDPGGETSEGFTRGGISDLNATLSVSRRISAVRLTGGVAADRYASDVRVAYHDLVLRERVMDRGRVTTDRRSWFANVSWTSLVFHSSAEFGWQVIPDPAGLPSDVDVDPVGWWAGVAFRLSI